MGREGSLKKSRSAPSVRPSSPSNSYFSESSAYSGSGSHASGATSVWEATYGGKGYEWRKCFSSNGSLLFKHNYFPPEKLERPWLDPSHPIQKFKRNREELNTIKQPNFTTDYQDASRPVPKLSDFPEIPLTGPDRLIGMQVFEQPKHGEIVHIKKLKAETNFKEPALWTKGPATEPKVLGLCGSPMYRWNTATVTPQQIKMDKMMAERNRKREELRKIFDPTMMSSYQEMCRSVSGEPRAAELTEKKLAQM